MIGFLITLGDVVLSNTSMDSGLLFQQMILWQLQLIGVIGLLSCLLQFQLHYLIYQRILTLFEIWSSFQT